MKTKNTMFVQLFGSQFSQWLGDAIVVACNRSFAAIEAWRRTYGHRPVEELSTNQVHEAVTAQDSPIILVDVRSKGERAISRIANSITVEEYESNRHRFEDKIVVPYCTVGGRSYLFAKRLADAGVATTNYREGILGWCRAELPLESPEGKLTFKVHTYWQIFRLPDQYQFQKKPEIRT